MKRGVSAVLSLLACTLAASACAVVLTPPVRSTNYGSPGRLKPGQVDLHGGIQIPYVAGGSSVALALNDWLQLEAGGDFSLAQEQRWSLGFGGMRITPIRQPWGHSIFSADVELGFGIGAGGECDQTEEPACSDRDLEWNDRLAGGGYAGIGLGLHIEYFSLFARGRFQLSYATGIPSTKWITGVGGFGWCILDVLYIYVAGGYGMYFNDADENEGALFEAGLSILFDVLSN